MEQQYGVPGSVSQAARTVLPGEPFDPPMPSQVPGPRPHEQMQAPAPVAQWNYQPAEPAYGAATYETPPVPGMTFPAQTQMAPPAAGAYPVASGDFASLHEYASLPVAQQYDAPPPQTMQAFPPPAAFPQAPPASTWPPAAPLPQQMQQGFGSQYAPGQPQQAYSPMQSSPLAAPLPPLPPAPFEDEQANDGGHRRAARKGIDKRLLALVGVVVIGGGGYFAYSQFGKSDSTTAAASAPVAAAPAVAKYNFPASVISFKLQSPAVSARAKAAALAKLKTYSPAAVRTASFASYSAGGEVTVLTFRPGAPKVTSQFASFQRFVARPGKGNVAVPAKRAVPGAAGGQMTCGGVRGPNALSWCVWHNQTTIGVTTFKGLPSTQLNETITRELRAFAEH